MTQHPDQLDLDALESAAKAEMPGEPKREVWRWQDLSITSLSHGYDRLEWYLTCPVFGRAGPFKTREDAQGVEDSRAPTKLTLERFARIADTRTWEEFDRLGDRSGFLYDTIYASLRDALRILTAWSPEVIADQAETITSQAEIIKGLVDALERIERWFGEFPATGKFWPADDGGDGMEMSYAACFGSNGERDFMRAVARQALASTRTPAGSDEARPDAGAVGGEGV